MEKQIKLKKKQKSITIVALVNAFLMSHHK